MKSEPAKILDDEEPIDGVFVIKEDLSVFLQENLDEEAKGGK